MVDVDDNGFVTRGTVRECLTPARIASLSPGTTIRVKPVPSRNGRYVSARDDDPSPT